VETPQYITTARILADRVLERTSGDACVAWALDAMRNGHDGMCVASLAGLVPPYNLFEVDEMVRSALSEIGVPIPSDSQCIADFVDECLRRGLARASDLGAALRDVSDVCVAQDMRSDLHDFYRLFYAYEELSSYPLDPQWYWPGATADTIDEIARDRIERHLRSK
jgi:hypothetical protein